MTSLTATAELVRLALRRERAIAPWWVLTLVVMALAMVGYIHRNMPTPDVMATYTEIINRNAFFRALGGGTVEPRVEVLATWRSGGFLYVLNGLAALMCVVRYTRADEDAGRVELLRGNVVGRRAPLTAALLVAGGVAVAGGALVAAAQLWLGLPPVGSIAYGAAVTAAGWVFAAVAAVCAQLVRAARTATAAAVCVLGVSYVLRYAADATGQYWMSYLSPLGWSYLVEPYSDQRWWMLPVSVAVAAALATLAYRLLDTRDLGAGLMPDRPGPDSAPAVRGAVSLSWRLHRNLLASWAVGIGAFAAAAAGVGTLAGQMADAPGMAAMVGGLFANVGGPNATVLGIFEWYALLILAYVIALYPVLMIRRLRAEETSGRVDAVAATPLTRLRWAGGHLVVTWLGTTALLLVAGGVHGLVISLLLGDVRSDLPRILGAAASLAPAAWLVGAVCVLAYGLLPRACVAIGWAVWALTAVGGRVAGPIYGVWAGSPFEPFHYLPDVLAGAPFAGATTATLLGLCALLAGAGMLALRRRDLG